MPGSRAAVFKNLVGWLMLVLSVIAVVGHFSLPAIGCNLFQTLDGLDLTSFFLSIGLGFAILAFAAIGRMLTLFRPENRTGWLVTVGGFSLSIINVLGVYVDCSIEQNLSLPLADMSAWFAMVGGSIALICLFILLPAVFPTGKFVSHAWENVIKFAVISISILVFFSAVAPGPMTMNGLIGGVPLENPFGLPMPGLRRFEKALFFGIPVSIIAAALLGIGAFIARFRRSTGDERQQLKWFAFFLSTVVTVHIVGFELIGGLFYPEILDHWSFGIITAVSFSGFPLVIGLTVFKYRLYDIDLVVRRTLQYTLLTGLLSGIYFGGIALLQTLLSAVGGQRSSPIVIVLTTLLIAALFNPLRRRLQDFIDRRFYRQKYDAEIALARFAEAARSQTDLDQLSDHLTNTVQETLQPEHLSLWLNPDQRKDGGFQ